MIVCKIGGAAGIDLDAVCDDVATLVQRGTPLVLVHGGSARTNEVATALGHPPRFVTSPSGYTSRVTDRATLEVFEMVYCGAVNKGIVERLARRGVRALGMSGLDAGLWRGRRKKAIRAVENGKVKVLRDGYTGSVDEVDGGLLEALLERGLLPVLTPPGVSLEGDAINVDGDRAASATARALNADTLLMLSNVPGYLADFPDEDSLVTSLDREGLGAAREGAEGRMRVKLLAAEEALDGGVARVVIGDARGARRGQRRATAASAASIVARLPENNATGWPTELQPEAQLLQRLFADPRGQVQASVDLVAAAFTRVFGDIVGVQVANAVRAGLQQARRSPAILGGGVGGRSREKAPKIYSMCKVVYQNQCKYLVKIAFR